MIATERTVSLILFAGFAFCGAGAGICHLLASHSPRSQVALRLMEHEGETLSGNPMLYEPDDELLSERGLVLRARARKFGRAAFGWLALIAAYLVYTDFGAV